MAGEGNVKSFFRKIFSNEKQRKREKEKEKYYYGLIYQEMLDQKSTALINIKSALLSELQFADRKVIKNP